LSGIFNDLSLAVRRLARTPGFTLAALAIVALAVGANTAIFSLISSMLYRPLPFAEPGNLAAVFQQRGTPDSKREPVAMGNFVDLQAQNRTFSGLGAIETRRFQVTGGGDPEELEGGIVTAGLFPALGVQPLLGRWFAEGEDGPGAAKTVILSHALWSRRYNANRSIVGGAIWLNDERYAVIGVMPARCRFPDSDTDLWIPFGAAFKAQEWNRRDRNNLLVVGRLRPGASMVHANADVRAIAASRWPQAGMAGKPGAVVTPLRDYLQGFLGERTRLYWILFGAVALVLMIACANLANLQLARAHHARRHAAIARALGATGGRIARQAIVESCVLGVSGGALGLLLAAFSFDFLRNLIPPETARITPLMLDYRVVAFSAILSIVTGVLFGLAPAIQLLRTDVMRTLKQSSFRSAPPASRLRFVLLCTQIALCFVLLVGASLLVQTLSRLRGVDLGFAPKGVLTAEIRLASRYKTPEQRIAFYEQVLSGVRSIPGVTSAGLVTGVPLALKGARTGVSVERADGIFASPGPVNNRSVSPDYLRTLGVPLVQGRPILESDAPEGQPVLLVNESMARMCWPGQPPLGRRVKTGRPQSKNPWMTVVGVVRDVKQAGLDVPSRPEMYLPLRQAIEQGVAIALRTAPEPGTIIPALRSLIRSVDSESQLREVRTMDEVLDKEIFPHRIPAVFLIGLAALALLVSAVGVYGVVSYWVEQRTPEIGLRSALGAQPKDILAAVLKDGLTVILTGVAIGVAGALALTRALATLLFGLGPRDPATFCVVAIVLAGVTLLAVLIPARRAARVDPVIALRYD
jgi:putative ABC transport system permease protein